MIGFVAEAIKPYVKNPLLITVCFGLMIGAPITSLFLVIHNLYASMRIYYFISFVFSLLLVTLYSRSYYDNRAVNVMDVHSPSEHSYYESDACFYEE